MRVYLGMAAAVLLGVVGTLRAEPLNLEHIAADAKWVMHVDADAIRDSAIAEKAHGHIQQNHPEAGKHLAKIREVWNFDPCNDLHGFTVYGAKIKPNTGVAILHAKVDQELLLRKARSAPEHRETTYGQYQLHTWKHKGHGQSVEMTGAFYRPNIIVFSNSIDDVKAALDVLDGTSSNLVGKDSPLTGEISQGTMFLSRVIGLADAENLPPHPMLKQIDSMSIAMGEYKEEVFFVGYAAMKETAFAEQMKSVIEGARAMAVMANNGDAESMEIINALKINVDENMVEAEWRSPVDKFWDFAKKMEERQRQHMSQFAPPFPHNFGEGGY